jgi:hypothetical protein
MAAAARGDRQRVSAGSCCRSSEVQRNGRDLKSTSAGFAAASRRRRAPSSHRGSSTTRPTGATGPLDRAVPERTACERVKRYWKISVAATTHTAQIFLIGVVAVERSRQDGGADDWAWTVS